MPIYIYNSLSRRKEEFIPLNPPQVNIYTCGVTVYDESHIGHARSLYIFDVIRRYLKYRGFNVKFVRNITDIDDKIINRAKEIKMDWKGLVGKYIALYKKDLEILGIQEGDCEPRATENIADMIKHIEELINKGFAYITDSGVYFNVRKFKDYGKLSGQGIDQMLSGARIEPDEAKQDPLDFALWKISKPDDPSWPSPWGQGRPGWHIECSVMSQKFLKIDTLDIHAGGRDLIFPHHENEIAQAEALTGKPFAKYWIHHGLLTINGQKMAKSLGNFVTIKTALEGLPDAHAADILKDFFLRTHYSSPIDYSSEAIREAKEEIFRFSKAAEQPPNIVTAKDNSKDNSENEHTEYVNGLGDSFKSAMDNDFNMPQARAALCELVRYCNRLEDRWKVGHRYLFSVIQYTKNMLRELASILGLSLNSVNEHDPKWGDISLTNVLSNVLIEAQEIQKKIDERTKMRREKRYSDADKIKKELLGKGILLKDKEDGTTEWEWKK